MVKQIFTKRNIFATTGLITLVGLIGFVEKKSSEKIVHNVIVRIEDQYGNHFVDEGDVARIITINNRDSVRGRYFDEVDLKKLERSIEQNKFVENAEVYKDHKGNLLIDVTQHTPIARIVQTNGQHAYIGDKGNLLPVSDKYTARVVIVDGENAGRMMDPAYRNSEDGKALVEMIRQLKEDPFLNAQISQITYRRNGEIELRPQVGDEVIFFGKPEELEVKFKKIKIYYKEIIQAKGFNKYKTVNLKYKDQIICE